MKLLSVAVPCYNSEAYMEHCVETLVSGGDERKLYRSTIPARNVDKQVSYVKSFIHFVTPPL